MLEAEVLAKLLEECETPAWVSFSCPDGEHISDGTLIEEAANLFGTLRTVAAVGINCTPPQYARELVTRIAGVLPDKAVDLRGYEVWTPDEDGLIPESHGRVDDAEYQRQLNARPATSGLEE
jgi:S-methylmethionine-dependent homocysteine/selenocysteine methylase